jgi:hypothetical protein
MITMMDHLQQKPKSKRRSMRRILVRVNRVLIPVRTVAVVREDRYPILTAAVQILVLTHAIMRLSGVNKEGSYN